MKILKFILRIFALLGLSYVPFVMTLAIFSDFGIIDKTLNTIPLFFIVFGVLAVIMFQKLKTPYYETKAICMSGISEYERVKYEEEWLQRTAIDLINYFLFG